MSYENIKACLDAATCCDLIGHEDRCFDSALLEGSQLVATASEDGTARIWDLDEMKAIGIVKSSNDHEVLRVAWAPSIVTQVAGAPLLATANADGSACVWRFSYTHKKADLLSSFKHTNGEQMYGCTWAQRESEAWLVTGCGNEILLWDITLGSQVGGWCFDETAPREPMAKRTKREERKKQNKRPDAAGLSIFDIQINQRHLACALSDASVRICDMFTADCIAQLSVGGKRVAALSWATNTHYLAIAATMGQVILYDTENWHLFATISTSVPSSTLYGCAWIPHSASKSTLVSWASDGKLFFWTVSTNSQQRRDNEKEKNENTTVVSLDFPIYHSTIVPPASMEKDLRLLLVGGDGTADSTSVAVIAIPPIEENKRVETSTSSSVQEAMTAVTTAAS